MGCLLWLALRLSPLAPEGNYPRRVIFAVFCRRGEGGGSGGRQRPRPSRDASRAPPAVRQDAIFIVTMPATIIAAAASRIAVTGSARNTTPTTKLPTAPMPVQTM